MIERLLFASRWLLAPFYIGLAIGLLMLLVAFVHEAFERVVHVWSARVDQTIVGMLSLIDLSLVANLILIVMWAGYENFVSKIDFKDHPDRPSWIAHIGYGDLKIKLLTSIVAISAIRLLEGFMHIDTTSNRELGWAVGIHLTFIASGVLLAVMDRLGDKDRG
ncbi:MAG: TIGR00645 family protein [Proteobacteria bacterium]|nr:TIGR00645 family protein [Pseudomonadota bacterium]